MAKAKARKSSLPKLLERYYADLAEFARQKTFSLKWEPATPFTG